MYVLNCDVHLVNVYMHVYKLGQCVDLKDHFDYIVCVKCFDVGNLHIATHMNNCNGSIIANGVAKRKGGGARTLQN